MNAVAWTVRSAGLAVAAGIGLVALGRSHWQASTRARMAGLEAARLSTPADRYDAREIEGLPVPVQRCFRAVLNDGQPIIIAATIGLAGTINMSATGKQWKPFTSTQRAVAPRPGFLWNGRVAMLPGVPAYVHDSYIDGVGALHAALLGLLWPTHRAAARTLEVNSCVILKKWRGTRPRCCPVRACPGKR